MCKKLERRRWSDHDEGTNTNIIFFYEEHGMLCPRSRGQDRVFGHKDLVALRLLLRGKCLGFSLVEREEVIDLYGPVGGSRTQREQQLSDIR